MISVRNNIAYRFKPCRIAIENKLLEIKMLNGMPETLFESRDIMTIVRGIIIMNIFGALKIN